MNNQENFSIVLRIVWNPHRFIMVDKKNKDYAIEFFLNLIEDLYFLHNSISQQITSN